jgi:type II secretory pathway pseudopilin PulG
VSTVTICPCCGERLAGELGEGCGACGARPVGPPLARPERELPGYGHAFAVCAAGLLMLLAFVVATAAALVGFEDVTPDWETLLRAAETAAWRLKWTALPAGFVLTGVCAWLRARMRREPACFVGHRHARAGLVTTALVALLLAALVGVTVPERVRLRELARRAAENAVLYETDLALARYRKRFGTYPASLSDLRRLEDPDGSVARLLATIAPGEYRPEADVASIGAGRAKARGRRRVSALPARASGADDATDAGLSLTSYELSLPGRDHVLGTDDDLHIRDGRITDAPRTPASPATTRATRSF